MDENRDQQNGSGQHAMSPRYDDHIGASLALAFGGGLVLGMLLSPHETAKRAGAGSDKPLKARLLRPLSAMDQDGRLTRQVGETWNHILDALVAVATAKAVDMVGSAIPGFRDHYPGGPPRPAAGRPSEW